METKKRLVEYLKTKGIGQTDFEEKAGLSRGQTAKKQGLTSPSLGKISNYFPELNMNWLLTGKGEMECTAQSPTDNPQMAAYLDKKDNEIRFLYQEIGRLSLLLEQSKKTPVQVRREMETSKL